eukprot:GEMP01043103.1.p1 GENE.GEMP01043103.1~~GEMP01043103.1.p1  ORF type:complete len:266 (+),score=34.67 GEMP01043103.1:91-888(+)
MRLTLTTQAPYTVYTMKFSTIVLFLAQVAADTQYVLEVTFEETSCSFYTYELRVTSNPVAAVEPSTYQSNVANAVLRKKRHIKQTEVMRVNTYSDFSFGDLKWRLGSTNGVGLIIFSEGELKSATYVLVPTDVVEIHFSSARVPGKVERGSTMEILPQRRLRGLAGEGGGVLLSEGACSKVSHYEWPAWLTAVILVIVSAAVLATIYWVWRRQLQREAPTAQENVEEEPNVRTSGHRKEKEDVRDSQVLPQVEVDHGKNLDAHAV